MENLSIRANPHTSPNNSLPYLTTNDKPAHCSIVQHRTTEEKVASISSLLCPTSCVAGLLLLRMISLRSLALKVIIGHLALLLALTVHPTYILFQIMSLHPVDIFATTVSPSAALVLY